MCDVDKAKLLRLVDLADEMANAILDPTKGQLAAKLPAIAYMNFRKDDDATSGESEAPTVPALPMSESSQQ